MILTEEEAKTKICATLSTRYNAPSKMEEIFEKVTHPKCLATDCCHWRWCGAHVPGLAVGYCGLAGMPQL